MSRNRTLTMGAVVAIAIGVVTALSSARHEPTAIPSVDVPPTAEAQRP